MELQKIVVLCVVGVGIIFGGWYLFTSEPNETKNSQTNIESTETNLAETSDQTLEEDSTSGVGPLMALLGRGDSMRCEYSFAEEGASGEGVGYFSDEKMRVETNYKDKDGGSYVANMIHDGNMMYTWTTGPEGSFAMKFVPPTEGEMAEEKIPTNPSQVEEFSIEQNVTYECSNWRPDPGQFVPPSDIEFMDMASMMQGMFEGMPGRP